MTTLTWILLGMCIGLPLTHVGCVLLGAKLMHWKIGQRMDQALVEAMTAEQDDAQGKQDDPAPYVPDEVPMTEAEQQEEDELIAQASWTL